MTFLSLWLIEAILLLQTAPLPVVKDFDGNVYHTVTIGKQIWLLENLSTTHFNNGDAIPQVTDNDEWSKAIDGAFCYFMNDSIDPKANGILYNAYAMEDSRGLAPPGYRIATNDDWNQLCVFMGADTSRAEQEPGIKMPPLIGEGEPLNFYLMGDESPFKGIYTGGRMSDGRFGGRDYNAYWWSITPYSSINAYFVQPSNMYEGTRFYPYTAHKTVGFTIRCIKE